MANRTHNREQLDDLIQGYIVDTKSSEWTPVAVAAWAINSGKFDVPFESKVKALSGQLSNHMTKQELIAPNGKRTRKYVCAKSQKEFIWSDVRYCKPNFFYASCRHRRDDGHAALESLRSDIETWNECYRPDGVEEFRMDLSWHDGGGDQLSRSA